MESLNMDAINEIAKKCEFILMGDNTIIEFAKTTHNFLEDLKSKNPDVKKSLESQEILRRDFAKWREIRARVAPWPYEMYIKGILTQ